MDGPGWPQKLRNGFLSPLSTAILIPRRHPALQGLSPKALFDEGMWPPTAQGARPPAPIPAVSPDSPLLGCKQCFISRSLQLQPRWLSPGAGGLRSQHGPVPLPPARDGQDLRALPARLLWAATHRGLQEVRVGHDKRGSRGSCSCSLLPAHRSPLLGASCECHPAGSRDSGCHALTGQCSCQPGVTGLRCDRCDHGFFGFSAKGCRGNRNRGHHLGPKIGAGSRSVMPSCHRCSLQLLPAGLRHAAVPREQHLRLPPRLCGLQVRAVPGQLLPRPAELPLPAVPLLLRAGEGRGTARALPRR